MRRALAIAAGLLPAISARADIEEKGVRAGGVVFAMSRDNADPLDREGIVSRPGWMLGAWATWRNSDTFGFQVESAISNKALRTEICGGFGMVGQCTTTADISLYYLEVPLLLRLDLLRKATKLFVVVGGEAAVSLGGGRTPSDGSGYQRFEDLSALNVGGVLGIGFALPMGPGKLAIDLRYMRWFRPITGPLDGDDLSTSFGMPDQGIVPSHHVMLAAGYAFP